jgi:hypothetical protein
MKKINVLLLFFLSSLLISPCFGQEQFQYGSNDGQYISLFSKQIYFEEYGSGPALLLLHGGFGSISDFAKLSQAYQITLE